jgi:Mor family transcriptional regulator
MARSPMDNAVKIKIYALYNQGVSTNNIAARFGLSRQHIADVVRKTKLKHGKN